MKESEKSKNLAIDGDILLYSIGWGSEDIQESWIVDQRIENFFSNLFKNVGTSKYKVYLTGKGNFRNDLAVSHKYKGNRKKEKPKWYKYIKDYLMYMYNTDLIEGMEADDAMAMHLTRDKNAVCCSIDKDLLQVEGWHYSWKTHNRDEMPLRYVDYWGKLERREKKLYGEGVIWLYAQSLLGDSTDNIIGIKGYGNVKVYNTLKDCKTETELYNVVKEAYEGQHGEEAEVKLKENMDLLWMVRELTDRGEPILWQAPIIS
tara:strand:+ start:535 stop:1314 length:780 start_codon:yes stop_codon:yes gene_type:complete